MDILLRRTLIILKILLISFMPIKKPEIMAPIQNFASLEACRDYADAVYFGLSNLTMRANADAFTLQNIGKFVDKCHDYKIKAYLTVNSVIYNSDIKIAEKIIKKAKQVKVDAVIVWDPAVIEICHKLKQKFFISTQANISNWQTAEFYKKLGASRVVLAREMTLKQIKELRQKVKHIEIETFVHGAMCLSVSGRCILSAYLYGKSANCGSCAQPCRKEWILSDNEGNKISTEGKYFMSAKDLCMIEYVPQLIKAGIDSFKIEGRRRDPNYIATTARCYKEAVDAYFDKTFTLDKVAKWKKELAGVYNRGFSTGFYFGTPGKEGINYDHSGNIATTKKILVGYVKKYYAKIKVAEISLESCGLKVGDEISIEGHTTYLKQQVDSIELAGENLKIAKKGMLIGVKVVKRVRRNDKVFVLH